MVEILGIDGRRVKVVAGDRLKVRGNLFMCLKEGEEVIVRLLGGNDGAECVKCKGGLHPLSLNAGADGVLRGFEIVVD